MLKAEFKVGLIYINKNQTKEEQFFTNTHHSKDFEDFLSCIGDRIKLKGFKGYNGGLDTENNLTGESSIYKEYQKYKIMFHVSTLLPMEEHDDQKVCLFLFQFVLAQHCWSERFYRSERNILKLKKNFINEIRWLTCGYY